MAISSLKSPSLYGDDIEAKREEIKRYFNTTYELYEELFRHIKDEKAYFIKANPLRHPLIFYYGHTAVFFINKLILAKVIDKRIDKRLESIFAVGVDEMSWDDLDESHYDWPTLDQTKLYRDRVKEIVNSVIDSLDLSLPITWDSPWWVVLMGIEHERIHLETSSVLMRELPLKYLQEVDGWEYCLESKTPNKNELLDVSGGVVEYGKSFEDDYYGWDNEYGKERIVVEDFKASKYLVSNKEFLEFMQDGGYERVEFWEEEGRAWLEFSKAKTPHFWVKEDERFKLRHIAREVDLPLNHPVEVNYHEAKAYCNWLGKKEGIKLKLPIEAEWYHLAKRATIKDANIELKHFASTVPNDRFKHGEFYDLIGNVWQWSESVIYPFDGFRVHPIYDDFTVPTFDNRHNLIKGGSFISTGNEAIYLNSRYAFRRHFFQIAGFRYVQSENSEKRDENIYESDENISQYIEFGWGKSYFRVKNFPKRCVDIALEYIKDAPKKKALDIGCAIGRSSFELARVFDEVVGVDFSTRFINHAVLLKERGSISYKIKVEGDIEEFKRVELRDFDLSDVANRVNFYQADACNLKPIYKGYDLIFAGNLIDRLYNPKAFLKTLSDRVNSGGYLILTSPYTWLEEFTPKDEWVGGFKRDGENLYTIDGIKEILSKDFELIDTKDIEFVIRETKRKYQHTISQMSIWKRL